MYTLQAKLIGLAIVLLSILGVGYSTYSYVYSKGQNAAQLECIARFDKYQKELDAKVAVLEGNLATLVATSLDQQLLVQKDVNEILKRVKKTPVTIVKNGKCYPSPTFVEGINQAVDRANKR